MLLSMPEGEKARRQAARRAVAMARKTARKVRAWRGVVARAR